MLTFRCHLEFVSLFILSIIKYHDATVHICLTIFIALLVANSVLSTLKVFYMKIFALSVIIRSKISDFMLNVSFYLSLYTVCADVSQFSK